MNRVSPKIENCAVAVLMGGTSSERPVSLSTGKMILGALDRKGTRPSRWTRKT